MFAQLHNLNYMELLNKYDCLVNEISTSICLSSFVAKLCVVIKGSRQKKLRPKLGFWTNWLDNFPKISPRFLQDFPKISETEFAIRGSFLPLLGEVSYLFRGEYELGEVSYLFRGGLELGD